MRQVSGWGGHAFLHKVAPSSGLAHSRSFAQKPEAGSGDWALLSYFSSEPGARSPSDLTLQLKINQSAEAVSRFGQI